MNPPTHKISGTFNGLRDEAIEARACSGYDIPEKSPRGLNLRIEGGCRRPFSCRPLQSLELFELLVL